jgi:hypothetical protein
MLLTFSAREIQLEMEVTLPIEVKGMSLWTMTVKRKPSN